MKTQEANDELLARWLAQGDELAEHERERLEQESASLALAFEASDVFNGGAVYSQDEVMERRLPNVIAQCVRCERSSRPSGLRYLHLCSDFDYYASNVWGYGWDCGYKNVQMILSCLLRHKHFRERLAQNDVHEVPTVTELQMRLENAWADGFDADGAHELNGRVVDENKWIGPSEVVIILRSMWIRASIVTVSTGATSGIEARDELVRRTQAFFGERCANDSSEDSASNSFLSKFGKLSLTGRRRFRAPASRRLCDWCSAEGSRLRSRAESSIIAPLFLQSPGHSQLIVGIEEYSERGPCLLLADPKLGFTQQHAKAENVEHMRQAFEELDSNIFQLVMIPDDGLIADRAEWERSKSLLS